MSVVIQLRPGQGEQRVSTTSKSAFDNRTALALVLLFFACLPAVTPRIFASDEVQYFANVRSLWFDHDLSFENEYRHFYDAGVAASPGFHETFLERTTETGRRINFGPIGSALLWMPFYAAGDLAARIGRAAGYDVAIDGFSQPYIAAVCYGSALYGFAAVILSLLVARKVVGEGQVAAAAVWLGTPLLFYMYVAPPMAHAPSAFAVAAFIWVWLNARRRWSTRGFLALGALAGLMAIVREQDLFFIVGPMLDLAWSRLRQSETGSPVARQPRATLILNLAAGLAAFAIVFAPQAVAYLVLNGRLGPSRLVERKMDWTAPHALQVLASPEHGFLWWTPLAVIALAGLLWLALGAHGVGLALNDADAGREATGGADPDASRIALCALAMIAVQVYVAGSVGSWTVAGAFGQRRFVALTALLTLGVAAAICAARRPLARATLMLTVLLCVWWNIGLMAQFGAGMMDRQRLDLPRNAYATFAVLPRKLPMLAYRYLFDRQSFYKPQHSD